VRELHCDPDRCIVRMDRAETPVSLASYIDRLEEQCGGLEEALSGAPAP